MTIKELQKHLRAVIKDKKNKPTDQVVFRSEGSRGELKDVDYLLTAVKKNTLTLCYDDGMF